MMEGWPLGIWRRSYQQRKHFANSINEPLSEPPSFYTDFAGVVF